MGNLKNLNAMFRFARPEEKVRYVGNVAIMFCKLVKCAGRTFFYF